MYRWTFIHLKAPTQVTCAHCQRSQGLAELSSFRAPGHFVRGSRISYIVIRIRQHLGKNFFLPDRPADSPVVPSAAWPVKAARRRGAHLTSVCRFVNTRGRKIFLPRDSRETPSPHGHGPATKGRESYNQSAIRQPPCGGKIRRRPDVRARTRACRAATGVPSPARRPARDPPRPLRRPAMHARRACEWPLNC